MADLIQYLHVALVAGAELWERALRALIYPWHWLWQSLEAAPERLVIAPQDIRTSDPTIAEDIYAGYFAFSGRIVNAHGRSPFDLDPPTPNWARGLFGFGWLRHLRAADTVLARANARALVDDFISLAPGLEPLAFEPRVASRRLISMLSQSPVILDMADRNFYRRFMKHLAMTKARLQLQFACQARGEARLQIAVALVFYALCAQAPPRAERRATRHLIREIDAQILADGGHVSRNPRPIVEFLLDFLPLRQAYAARGMAAPQALMNAIDRMMPMLRLFRHGDGALALFNGMGVTAPDTLAIALAYDNAHAKPNSNARYSGYQRLEAAGVTALVDAGRSPPRQFSSEAHAGCLAFEMSDGDRRLIVNCGAPDAARLDIRRAARATAAHSTLTIADTSSCRFARSAGLEALIEGQVIDGPRRVIVERSDDADAATIRVRHNGYARRFGLIHVRRLRLSADGDQLVGEDRLKPAKTRSRSKEVDFAIRFHLHPNVTTQVEGEDSVLLQLSNGRSWRFRAPDQPVSVEESIFFVAANGARATRQIVIAGRAFGEARVRWFLERVEP